MLENDRQDMCVSNMSVSDIPCDNQTALRRKITTISEVLAKAANPSVWTGKAELCGDVVCCRETSSSDLTHVPSAGL